MILSCVVLQIVGRFHSMPVRSARFKLERAGFWLIRLVHLYPNSDRADIDWESYWTSFSFEVD